VAGRKYGGRMSLWIYEERKAASCGDRGVREAWRGNVAMRAVRLGSAADNIRSRGTTAELEHGYFLP
jgi:hypothetical protein